MLKPRLMRQSTTDTTVHDLYYLAIISCCWPITLDRSTMSGVGQWDMLMLLPYFCACTMTESCKPLMLVYTIAQRRLLKANLPWMTLREIGQCKCI